MDSPRKPLPEELELIGYLISLSDVTFPDNWFENLLVSPREGDTSGSIYLYPTGEVKEGRTYSKTISEYQVEEGGVLVIASLNVDTEGNLYELDIWRGDVPIPPPPSLN